MYCPQAYRLRIILIIAHPLIFTLLDFNPPEPVLDQPLPAATCQPNWERDVSTTSKEEKLNGSSNKPKLENTVAEKESSVKPASERGHKVDKARPERKVSKVKKAEKEDSGKQAPVPRNQKNKTKAPTTPAPTPTIAPAIKRSEIVATDQKILTTPKSKASKLSPAKSQKDNNISEQSSKSSASLKGGVESSSSVPRAQSPGPGSEKQSDEGGWIKATSRTHPHVHHQERSTSPVPHGAHVMTGHVTSKANQTAALLNSSKPRQEAVWVSSQESASDWGSEEIDLDDLQVISSCKTDDDKISE